MGSIKKAFDLTGKNALVTGGSRGLGLQIAEALGELGARVVISSRKAPDLEKAQAHLAGLDIKAEWIAADNSMDEDVKRLADEAIKKLGRVDILVNNAGATWGAPTEDHPIEAWDKVMNLNIRSLFLLSQQVAKHSMIPNKYGRIINLASIALLAMKAIALLVLVSGSEKPLPVFRAPQQSSLVLATSAIRRKLSGTSTAPIGPE